MVRQIYLGRLSRAGRLEASMPTGASCSHAVVHVRQGARVDRRTLIQTGDRACFCQARALGRGSMENGRRPLKHRQILHIRIPHPGHPSYCKILKSPSISLHSIPRFELAADCRWSALGSRYVRYQSVYEPASRSFLPSPFIPITSAKHFANSKTSSRPPARFFSKNPCALKTTDLFFFVHRGKCVTIPSTAHQA